MLNSAMKRLREQRTQLTCEVQTQVVGSQSRSAMMRMRYRRPHRLRPARSRINATLAASMAGAINIIRAEAAVVRQMRSGGAGVRAMPEVGRVLKRVSHGCHQQYPDADLPGKFCGTEMDS